MRLIDADGLELDEVIARSESYKDTLMRLINKIMDAPTIDPVKHGHWVEENTRTHSMQFKCSVCGGIAYYPQNHHTTETKRCGYEYCGHCGAKMDEKEETITPEEFTKRMKDIVKKYNDREDDLHIKADSLLTDVLTQLGYGEGVEIFWDAPKWYA